MNAEISLDNNLSGSWRSRYTELLVIHVAILFICLIMADLSKYGIQSRSILFAYLPQKA